MYIYIYMYIYMYIYIYVYIYVYIYIYISIRVAAVAACPEDGGSLTMTGTMEYAAPEVLEGESPSEQQEIHRRS